jgi:hypothetical protein
MSEKDHKLRFAAIMESLGVVYQQQMSKELLKMYWLALQDVHLDQLEQAAAAHVATSQWFPKPCDLRSANPEADAVRAWDSAIAAIHHHGMYRHVDFEDQVVNATIRHLGGWPEFCGMDPKDESWIRKEFVKTYQALAKAGTSKEQAAVLPGLSQANQVTRVNGEVGSQQVLVRRVAAPKIIDPKRRISVQSNAKKRIAAD